MRQQRLSDQEDALRGQEISNSLKAKNQGNSLVREARGSGGSMGQNLTELVKRFYKVSLFKREILTIKQNAEVFWEENGEQICQRLIEKLSNEQLKNPDIEIAIPVHKNRKDLIVLFYSLSHLDTESLPPIKILITLHNSDEETKQFVYELKNKLGNRIRVIQLDDKILSGAAIGWQLLAYFTKGKKIAFLDADSAVPSDWLKQLYQSISTDDNTFLAATGPRRYVDSDIMGEVYNLLVLTFLELRNLINRPVAKLVSGNSIVDGSILRNFINENQSIGGWYVDGFLQDYIEKSGYKIKFVPVTILTSGEKESGTIRESHKSLTILNRFINGLANAGIRLASSDQIVTFYLTQQVARHVPWTRRIIGKWVSNNYSISKAEIYQLLDEEALICGFSEDERYKSKMQELRSKFKASPDFGVPKRMSPKEFADILEYEIISSIFRPIALESFKSTAREIN